jgi:hypothetical protein
LHGVVNRKASRHHAAGRVDVHGDFLLGVFRFEEQQLGHHQRCHVIFNRAGQEDDALLEHARVNVVGALATVGLLDDHGNECGIGFNRIAHRESTSRCWLGPVPQRIGQKGWFNAIDRRYERQRK